MMQMHSTPNILWKIVLVSLHWIHEYKSVWGSHGKVLVVVSYRGICENLLEASPRSTNASWVHDRPMLAEAQPTRSRDSTSGFKYLRSTEKNPTVQQQTEKEVRTCGRNNAADSKFSEEGREEAALGATADSPAAHSERASPCSPRRFRVELRSTCTTPHGNR